MSHAFEPPRPTGAVPGARVLIADDEAAVAQTVAAVLGAEGLAVDFATSLAEARLKLEHTYSLLVLDLLFPDGNGLDLLQWLRSEQRRSLPVVVLSAVNRQDIKLRTFELGADDYLVKPFSPRELAARCIAVLRRVFGSSTVTFGPYRLDLTARSLFRGAVQIHVRPKEFDLLACLASHPGEAMSREQLVEQVWGDKPLAARQAVAVAVHSLRDKLEDDRGKPRYIRTVSRYGYRFDRGE